MAHRIAYVPLDQELRAPGDRRRFPHYARERGLPFDLVKRCSDHELVVVSEGADLTHWSQAPRKSKIVYDFIDAYLDIEPATMMARLRGPARYLFGQSERLELSFHDSIRNMCRRADAVVCSTPEQRETILPYNRNVHPILDYHGSEIVSKGTTPTDRGEVHLLWEGMARNLITFSTIAPVLQRLSRTHRLTLHVITDLSFRPLNGPVPAVPTHWLIDRVLPGVNVALCEWDRTTLSALAGACDLAIIPMFLDRGLYRQKAENKLLLFWRLGLPTLTAATPSYTRTMREAGIEMYCQTPQDWEERLNAFLSNPAARAQAAEKGPAYVQKNHGDESRTTAWDRMFESINATELFNRPGW